MNKPAKFPLQEVCEFHGPLGSPYNDFEPSHQADISNAPAANFPDIEAKSPNEINGRKSLDFDARSAAPLNLLGGGSHRFPGACRRTQAIAAAIDAEIGVPAREPVVSKDGVRSFLISAEGPVMIRLDTAGRRYGHLTVSYRRGHDIACRCICSRLIHISASALASGTTTSCGCQPAPEAFWTQQQQLRALMKREILFADGKAR